MLQKLSIHNYAIIDHLEINPGEGLTIVTGETGAGKSIILGALSLILGERADTSVLINKEEKCVVEAIFDVQGNLLFDKALKEADIDSADGQCIIRREIAINGKSRTFVNDTPVRLDVLNRLTTMLVDLHQQFDHLSLEDSSFQMDVIDAIAGLSEERTRFTSDFSLFKTAAKKLDDLLAQKSAWQKEADYKQYLLEELLNAAFKDEEIEQADSRLKQLAHAEKITQVLQEGLYKLQDGEVPVNNELKRLAQAITGLGSLLPGAAEIGERLNAVYVELKDIVSDIEQLSGTVTINGEEQAKLQERVDLGYRLLKKHGLSSTSELIKLQQELNMASQAGLDMDDAIDKSVAAKQRLLQDLTTSASRMSGVRKEHAAAFAARVTELLSLVGMPNAVFTVRIAERSHLNEYGIDNVEFYLDANKSGKALPVFKAASGGEMNRIMLCIKSLTAKAMQLPTLIFDEVDTGISGEAARQVGILLKELAGYHQVICITHQPQVAARGHHHMFVYKKPANDGRITTRISWLEKDERVMAIAQMIGGEQPGDAALRSARELLTA